MYSNLNQGIHLYMFFIAVSLKYADNLHLTISLSVCAKILIVIYRKENNYD